MKRFFYRLGLLTALSLPSAEAANREIRALFQPDPSQPNKNVFINKTPDSGYCADAPGQCADHNIFSIQLPVRVNSVRALQPGDGVSVKVPSNWRQLTVTNPDTQGTETVEVRIIGFGSWYALSDTATHLTGETEVLEGHRKLWRNNSWVNAPAPCQYSGFGYYWPDKYRFFWKAPVEAACTKVAAFTIPAMSFESVDFAYELRTPNPLGMSSGLYTGSMSYSIGPGGDFDFGPLMSPDDGNLTLDFVLDVQHTLKVELPPGGHKVAMEPAGGWQRWLDSGRMPTEIYRDQPFYLSASSRFKVMLICSSLGGSECNIGNNQVGFSKFEVKLTLPRGIVGPGGGDGWSGTLRHNNWVGPFEPSRYVDRKPGTLRFQMPSRWIQSLLKPGMNGTLWGHATIIFDSEA